MAVELGWSDGELSLSLSLLEVENGCDSFEGEIQV